MKRIISERHIVVFLFVVVFISFSLAHEDSKDIEQINAGLKPLPGVELTTSQIQQLQDAQILEDKKSSVYELDLR
jgi:hypothetical protein